MRVDATSYDDASSRVLRWTAERRSAYVCVANVHMAMETMDSPDFRQVVNEADLVTPDGRPLVWALQMLGVRDATQVRGTDLVAQVSARAAGEGVPIGLYGSTPEVLEELTEELRRRFPGLDVACGVSPPFRELTDEEDEKLTRQIAESGARILFVGLGCPKQERWMAAHRGRIPAVMIGVGAAFEFYTGRIPQAPRWMQSSGLEWAYRLYREPRRLWKRYARHNPRFVALLALQLVREYGRFGKKRR
jgi:N-acetylglucosaminyldiphosphoundecaprenol N-acetyl-beta-D-mannosaminyltransferase